MPVTATFELSPGMMKWVVVDRERVLIANVEGVFYALRDACGHRQAPLSKGRLPNHFPRKSVCQRRDRRTRSRRALVRALAVLDQRRHRRPPRTAARSAI